VLVVGSGPQARSIGRIDADGSALLGAAGDASRNYHDTGQVRFEFRYELTKCESHKILTMTSRSLHEQF
jgi:hypothetical protein